MNPFAKQERNGRTPEKSDCPRSSYVLPLENSEHEGPPDGNIQVVLCSVHDNLPSSFNSPSHAVMQ
jgi:hypothetical protein